MADDGLRLRGGGSSENGGAILISGLYSLPIQGTALPTGAMSANNREICFPWLIGAACVLNEIKTNVTSAGNVGSKIRLGLRADLAGLPGNVLADFGQVAGDAVTSPAIAITQALSVGWIWVSMTAQSAATTTPTTTVFSQGWHARCGTAAISASGAVGYYQDGVSGALSNPFTRVGTLIPTGVPVAWLKAA